MERVLLWRVEIGIHAISSQPVDDAVPVIPAKKPTVIPFDIATCREERRVMPVIMASSPHGPSPNPKDGLRVSRFQQRQHVVFRNRDTARRMRGVLLIKMEEDGTSKKGLGGESLCPSTTMKS